VSNHINRPTEEEAEECRKYWNLDVSEGGINDWYCVLRETQGTLHPYKEGLKYMRESNYLTEEYAYVINLDTNTFEFYADGKLEKTFDLVNIPRKWYETVDVD
jgi:hypothetical protein